MGSLGVGFILPAAKPTSSSSSGAGSRGRHASVVTVGATRGTGTGTAAAAGAKEEKNLFEWIWGALQKDEQLLETDPILKKVEDKAVPSSRSRAAASAPTPKSNGGGLFAKK